MFRVPNSGASRFFRGSCLRSCGSRGRNPRTPLHDGEGLDHGLVQRRLVALEGQHMVDAPVADRLCELLLATHGVHGHDAALQRRDGRDRVGPVVHPALTRCRGDTLRAWSCEPRAALPSTATSAAGSVAAKQASHWAGASRPKTRPEGSGEGMPYGRSRKVSSKACF